MNNHRTHGGHEKRREEKVLGRMHEGKLERTRLKFGPTERAHVDGEVQAFGVEACGFWNILV